MKREKPDGSRNHLARYLLPRSLVLVGKKGEHQDAIFSIYTFRENTLFPYHVRAMRPSCGRYNLPQIYPRCLAVKYLLQNSWPPDVSPV